MGAEAGEEKRGMDVGKETVREKQQQTEEQMKHEKRMETRILKDEGNESDRGFEGREEPRELECNNGEGEKTGEICDSEDRTLPVEGEDQSETAALVKEDLLGKEDRIKSLNHSTLYLGNLHPYVDDNVLKEVFAQFEGISELKVIKDRATGMSAGYGFARFFDKESAGIALESIKNQMLFGQPMKVNWALQKEKEDELGSHHHVFVGDLSSDVTDQALMEAFSHCQGCSDARVMWDFATGRTKGYGFVSFVTKEQAQYAIETMDGAQLGSRCIRCGWAQHKTESALPPDPRILNQTDPTNTNIYIGNMPGNVSNTEAKGYFSKYGTIVEMKLHRKGNYGFVRYKTHEEAVNAIVGLSSGESFNGRKLKCSWGRHPKVPPSGVKAQLMMAAVSQGPMVHNPHQNHRPSPLVQPSTYGNQQGMIAHGFSQGALFTNPHSMHLEREPIRMMDPLMESMSAINLYGNQGLMMPPLRVQSHQVGDPMSNQFYSTGGLPQQNTGASDPRKESKYESSSQRRPYSPNVDEAEASYPFPS